MRDGGVGRRRRFLVTAISVVWERGAAPAPATPFVMGMLPSSRLQVAGVLAWADAGKPMSSIETTMPWRDGLAWMVSRAKKVFVRFGSSLCSCHGYLYDLAERACRNASAPLNLAITPHKYLTDTMLSIGKDSKGALLT